MRRKLRVGLDLDGVVYDFIGNFDSFARARGEKIDETDYNRGLSEAKVKYLLDDFSKKRPFLWVPMMDGVKGNLERLSKKMDFYIVTHRRWTPHGVNDTLIRLREDEIPYKDVYFGKRKYEYANELELDLFIEDSLNNCKKIRDRSCANAILLDRPYNQGRADGIMRIKSLDELQ